MPVDYQWCDGDDVETGEMGECVRSVRQIKASIEEDVEFYENCGWLSAGVARPC
jgi:hypothetical protein